MFHWLTSLRFCVADNSSQALTRPPLTTEKSSQSVHQQRPTLNRNISNLSTQSPSGRVYLPPPPVGREHGQRNKSKTTLLSRIANHQAQRVPDPNPIYSNPVQTSFNWRSGRPMAGMLELERSRTRRERTFIGSECAVCEEPLEHTLRGERILQFSCGHVSHEACFYEYIKEFDAQYCPTCNAPLGLDTSRGGNVLDIGTIMIPFLAERRLIPSRKAEQYRSLRFNDQQRAKLQSEERPKHTGTVGSA